MKKTILAITALAALFCAGCGGKAAKSGGAAIRVYMAFVKGGTFSMGCTPECSDYEGPAHSVTVSDFYIGRYEVTQGQWKAVTGNNPSGFAGDDNLPVEQVSWDDVQEFIQKLNEMTGKKYRLPTEAEWEYAARGGHKGKGRMFSGGGVIDSVAWYEGNSGGRTHPVGAKPANELKIYDMSGNVWEWVNDRYGDYGGSPQINPTGPDKGKYRVGRGGGWDTEMASCRVFTRSIDSPENRDNNRGFRLAHDAKSGGAAKKDTATQEPAPPPQPDAKPVAVPMTLVAGGTFTMGCTGEQGEDCEDNEKPARRVTVSGFYISPREVTQELWKAVMDDNPSYFTGDGLPVESVGWYDVERFIRKLNAMTGKTYRLPTEAEWEYAARGGNQSKGYRYSGGDNIDDAAWYAENGNGETHAVGTKQANELGIYDMSGNVWEWTSGIYGIYGKDFRRALRGGSWERGAEDCRVSRRGGGTQGGPGNRHIGFRLVHDLDGGKAPSWKEDTVRQGALAAVSSVAGYPVAMAFVEGGTHIGADSSVAVASFYIGKYEVTQGLWMSVMGENRSHFRYADENTSLPVENVGGETVMEFIRKLNEKTGKNYRLPTGAEWEFAARGGNSGNGYEYSGGNTLDDVGWWRGNSGGKPRPVGAKQANELGIHDMSGNVSEWTSDKPSGGTFKEGDNCYFRRGCAWNDPFQFAPTSCRISYRDVMCVGNEKTGFRLAHDAELPEAESTGSGARNDSGAGGGIDTGAAEGGVDALEMVFVEGGGAFKARYFSTGEDDRDGDSEPVREEGYDEDLEPARRVRRVTAGGFYIGKYEVTQGLWKSVMGGNPSRFTGNDNLPVEKVNRDDIQEFINKLNAKTGEKYRLPTSLEWEYAARGGKKSNGYRYSGGDSLGDVAWYGYDAGGNSGGRTHPVGTKQPNELGIHDMTGNVREWTSDAEHVIRGGDWYNGAEVCPVYEYGNRFREYSHSTLGFRLARDAVGRKAGGPNAVGRKAGGSKR